MKKRFIFCLFVAAIYLIFLAVFCEEVHATNWHIEQIEKSHNLNNNVTTGIIATDSQGVSHLVYGGDSLFYYSYLNDSWIVETVDNDQAVTSAVLAMNSTDHPHIAYITESGILKYAYFDGNIWHKEVIDNIDISWGMISLALDSDGLPHIAFEDLNKIIKYAHLEGDQWQIGEIDSGSLCCIKIDPNNIPHVLFFKEDFNGWRIKYASYNGTQWNIQNIFTGDILFADMTLDTNGNPHIVIADFNNGLKYLYYDGNQWYTETVKNWKNWLSKVSISLDPNGLPHIAMFSWNAEQEVIQYFSRNSFGAWQAEVINNDYANSNGVLALTISASGAPHIVYNLNNGDIRYATLMDGQWKTQTVDQENGPVGEYPSMAVDENEHLHISYYDERNKALKYAYFDGTEWHTEFVDREGDVGYYTSLRLDSQGYPHISYYDSTNQRLKYAYYDGEKWNIEVIDNSGRWSSLAIDSYDQIYIAYFDYVNQDLKLAQYDGNNWNIEVIDSDGDVGHTPSLKLDVFGYPHIAYRDSSNQALKYAYFDGSQWNIEVVDNYNDTGLYPALALDSNGSPYIVYYSRWIDLFGGKHYTLRYVRKFDNGWRRRPIESSIGNLTPYISVALDSDDNAYMSYYYDNNWDKYEFRLYNFETEERDIIYPKAATRATYAHTSLAISPNNNFYVAFFDGYFLKYAFLVPKIEIYYTSTLLSEDFSDGIPTNWQIVNGGTEDTWTTENLCNRSVDSELLTSPWAIIDSDCAGFDGNQDDSLITPPIPVNENGCIFFSFAQYFKHYGTEKADVDISTDNGATWQNVLRMQDSNFGPEIRQIDLSSYVSPPQNILLRFHYYDANYEWYWIIDNVEVKFLSTSADFGDVNVGDTSESKNITIKNSGSAALVVSSLKIDGVNSSDFSIVGGTCPETPFNLEPGESCEVTVVFSPQGLGEKSAEIRITSNDPENPTKNIMLIGTGVATSFNLAVDISGSGSIESEPAGIACGETCSSEFAQSTSVTLIATPDEGSIFSGWGGDCEECGTNTECTIIMDSDKTCSATFESAPNESPVIDSFTVEPDSGEAPLEVTILCQAHDPDGSITTYEVDFGDGSPLAISTDGTFSHTYENPGTYEVTCTVYDEAEDSVTSEPVTVMVNAPLPTWQDVTEGIRVTHSRPLYDRLHRAFFVLIDVENTSEGALSGPIRMVITDPSIPVKSIEGVGLTPDGVTENGSPYFIIVPAGESLAPGAGLNGLRVNFELQRRRLTFGVKIEQYPLPQD